MWLANSYGKINLGLQVLERLPTGYHRVETGLCFIEWSDRFEVTQSNGYVLTLSEKSIPDDDRNLITQAYNTFETYVGLNNHYRFNIDKKIPAGAGLGGGSSNAALTLRILNKLEEAGLTDEELIDLSRPLGADIAFFIGGKTGLATGIGQDVELLDIQPDCWIVTVFPGFESFTADAYANCEPNPDPEFRITKILETEPIDEWRYLLQNDLEPFVIANHHLVGNIKDQFYEFGADYSSMSGSGSAIYGLFEQDFVGLNAYESFRDLGFKASLTKPGFKPDQRIFKSEN